MSSLIEQAAERLAQLRAAGVEVPDIDTPAPGAPAAGMSAPLSPWAPPAQQLDSEFDRGGVGLPATAPVLPAAPHLPDSSGKSRKVELNLAAPLQDGQKVLVPELGAIAPTTPVVPAVPARDAARSPGAKRTVDAGRCVPTSPIRVTIASQPGSTVAGCLKSIPVRAVAPTSRRELWGFGNGWLGHRRGAVAPERPAHAAEACSRSGQRWSGR